MENVNNKELGKILNQPRIEPYIRSITFPRYKSIVPGEHIEFTFPITVLVGKNGCNKSSILYALYGCPEDNSPGEYWFSTELDPIKESEESTNNQNIENTLYPKNCFFYSYRHPSAKKDVQVLKTRMKKEEKPDYWEPSRPIKKIGMTLDWKDIKKYSSRDTRWDLIIKNVVLLDFRSELSAFDKYFHFLPLIKTRTLNTKQDRLRKWTKNLKKVIESESGSFKFGKDGKEYIECNRALPEKITSEISKILEEDYEKIIHIRHSFFNGIGDSFLFHRSGEAYSEAFAGSGEFAVATLVSKIMEAEKKSLILLDEPETSLHPRAQEKLIFFLKRQVQSQAHQIVISTHSPYVIQELPADAIKILERTSQGVKIFNHCLPEEAFYILGDRNKNSITIFTEDKLASIIAEQALRAERPGMEKAIEFISLERGGEDIWKTHIISTFERNSSCSSKIFNFFLLDGDQNFIKNLNEQERKEFENFDDQNDKTQEALLEKILPFSSKGLNSLIYASISSTPPKDPNESESWKRKRRTKREVFVRKMKKHVFFLPMGKPEIWLEGKIRKSEEYREFYDDIPDSKNIDDSKNFFVTFTRRRTGFTHNHKISSKDILTVQATTLTDILKKNESLIQETCAIIGSILGSVEKIREPG